MISNTFERLARSILIQDVAQVPTEIWDISDDDERTVGQVLRQLFREHECVRINPYRPVLLRCEFLGQNGCTPFDGKPFPFAVFHPHRALFEAIEETDSEELYLNYEAFDNVSLGDPVADCTSEISDLLPGTTSLWDMLHFEHLFLKHDQSALVIVEPGEYSVLTLEDIVGRPAAKACWMSATLELENAALEFCKKDAATCLTRLPKERFEAAQQRMNDRGKRMDSMDSLLWLRSAGSREKLNALIGWSADDMGLPLLEFTMFCDKKTMLLKSKLGNRISKSTLKKTFEFAERLRNWCAHPMTEPELRFRSFKTLRDSILQVINLTVQLQYLTKEGAA